MNSRFTLAAVAFGLCAALLPSNLWAKHPVRNIPIVALALEPNNNQNRPNDYARAVEFANRTYLNAGIQFTLDSYTDVITMTDPDLNCFDDDPADDLSQARWWADWFLVNRGAMMILSRRYHAVRGYGCFYSCTSNHDCCPDSYDASLGRCRTASGGLSDVSCTGDPILGSYCYLPGYWSSIPNCFTDTPSACTASGCDLPDDAQNFLLFNPIDGDDRIDCFDHEVGHLLGLRHTHDSADLRCYDRSNGPEPWEGNCGAPQGSPPEDGDCDGTHYNCPGDTPWKNIMSYHGTCRKQHEGSHTTTSTWNQSLSPDQIGIIWRSIHEYWDDPGGDDFILGGAENLYLLRNDLHLRLTGHDHLSGLDMYAIGDGGWTKDRVKLYPGDFNGDGLLDLIASTDAGTHPGVSFYMATNEQGDLVHSETLMGPTYHSTSRIAVGNFRGDRADDVLVVTPVGTYVFVGSTTFSRQNPLSLLSGSPFASYSYPTYTPHVANFTGSWYRSLPVGTWMDTIADYQADIDAWGIHSNLQFDDVLMMSSSGSYAFRGQTEWYFSNPTFWTPQVTSTNLVFSGNFIDDQHDELVTLYASRLYMKMGATAFDPDGVAWISELMGSNPVFSVGNYSGDHHADFIALTTSSAKLFLGSPGTIQATNWVRTDLNTGNTRFAATDTTRKQYDDVLIYTTSGAFLYNGSNAPTYFSTGAYNNWDPNWGYPNATWIGR